jgi:hypothetical protein
LAAARIRHESHRTPGGLRASAAGSYHSLYLIDEAGSDTVADFTVGDLDAFYKQARLKFDDDESFKARARERGREAPRPSGPADHGTVECPRR